MTLLLTALALALLVAVPPVSAQNAPAAPAAIVLSHDSVLSRYKRFEDPSVLPWREANDRVAEFPRGHIDLLRWEAKNPGDAPSAPASNAKPATLDLAQALRLSLRQRPDLFTHADMNALEAGAVQVAFGLMKLGVPVSFSSFTAWFLRSFTAFSCAGSARH